ncbi:RNA 2',3'-cyclic phosphodiesterase [Sphingomonas edaphi]|uniref:RNA 2',3'-cyclic phosphodiesterase n=1 Tax=Sphingomonas edaphi TaxID=2315689 RepID=A0A418Q1R7_9SPHN|nr:RNA 2',3'-cyclic phosphodiesterase [Sphingomonas edaphi]RIX31885.1 RNA 2',3'-cyclic phosphodiesterase [Sphingomonas edaphi]
MHRLFVAIRPPPLIRDLLLDAMDGVPDISWQDDEQLHLTLRFIGEVERPLAEDIAFALDRIRFEKFDLALAGVGQFEQHRRGTLWADVTPKEQLRALAAKVERACQSAGVTAERRAFHPHITLARWKGPKPRLDEFLQLNVSLCSNSWEVDQFVLYESRLGHEGAHYEAVTTYPLTG